MTIFAIDRDEDPAMAAERHLEKTLAKHPVAGPADLTRHRHYKGVTQELRQLQLRQSDFTEMGEAQLVDRMQTAIEALEDVRRGLANG